eukprot:1143617-Pelagomonas_calceolata.AAC.4
MHATQHQVNQQSIVNCMQANTWHAWQGRANQTCCELHATQHQASQGEHKVGSGNDELGISSGLQGKPQLEWGKARHRSRVEVEVVINDCIPWSNVPVHLLQDTAGCD